MTTRFYSYSKLFVVGILLTACCVIVPLFAHAESVTATPKLETPAEIKIKTKEFFADAPVMITIAGCESTFRQFTDSGNVFRDASGRYVGIFQIADSVHKDKALTLGFDIYTVEGNMGYAQYLYSKEGSRPWANCAKKYIAPTEKKPIETDSNDKKSTSVKSKLGSGKCPTDMQVKQSLRVGDHDGKFSSRTKNAIKEVAVLQGHINRILKEKYDEAAGPTDGIFGSKTKRGVERLQTVLNEVLKPEQLLVVDGIVGPFTRAAINDSCGKE